MPKGELDVLHPKLSISWVLTAILVVIMVLVVIGVGSYLYSKAKTIIPSSTAGDF